MRSCILILSLVTLSFACGSDNEVVVEEIQLDQIAFDQTKWQTQDGKDYPYRKGMLNDVVYNDTIRSLDEPALLALLGEPDRRNEGHLYYRVSQKRLFAWPLHTTTMVVKLTESGQIEWIKIHE